jgi:hypothetical protein
VSNALFRLPLAGATSTALMSSQGKFIYTAFGPTTFYWSDGTMISSISLTGGAVSTASASPIKTLYKAPANHSLVTIGVFGNALYWLELPDSSGQYPVLMKLTPN